MQRGSKLLFLLFALFCACGQAFACPSVADVDVKLTIDPGKALVEVRNGPMIATRIPAPLVEWQPGTGGIERRVWRLGGAEIIRCVMIDYSFGFQKWSELAADDGVLWEYSLEELAKRYCLTGGEYMLQAIFHNEIGSDRLSKAVISNPALVTIPQ